MPVPLRRRFTMLDILVLVGATAVGLAPVRGLYAVQAAKPLAMSLPNAQIMASITIGLTVVSPVLLSWTVADLILCLRRPRPRLRRLARQPGAMAAMAVIAWSTIQLTVMLAGLAVRPRPLRMSPEYFARTSAMLCSFAAPTIFAVWLTLAFCGFWRPEPTWLDRFGRALGLSWMGLLVISRMRGFL